MCSKNIMDEEILLGDSESDGDIFSDEKMYNTQPVHSSVLISVQGFKF